MVKRVNAKISDSANDWLDKKALELGMTKSALISVSVEKYIKESETVDSMPKLLKVLEEHGVQVDKL